LNNAAKHVTELDIIEVIRIILKNRWLVIAIVSIAGIAAVVYSLITPQIWKSDAAFYAVSSREKSLSLSIASLGKIAEDLLDQNMQNEAVNCVTIMNSRNFSEEVIRRFGLINYFKLTDPDSLANMDDALRLLKKVVATDYKDKNNLITVEVETKSKSFSRDIAEFYVDNLESYLQNKRMVNGRRNRIYLENRVEEIWDSIDSLQTVISDFKSKHKAVDLQQQSSGLISQYSNLVSSRMKLEISLDVAKINYSPNSPIVQDLELQLAGINKQINELEHSGDELRPKFQLDFSSIPSLTANQAQLQLNLNILTEVFGYVRPQYEKAKLEEQKNLPQLEILDSPRVAGRRVRPRRAMICLITVLMAGFMSVLMVIVKEIIIAQPKRLRELKDTLYENQNNKQ
jgi:capsule polysaccharide export protein KpsE/RkpR